MKLEYYLSKLIKKLRLRSILNSEVHKTSSIASGTQFVDSTMNRHSFCGYDCSILSTEIGSFCSIASNCEIGGASHTVDWISTSPVFNENRDQIKMKYSHHMYNAQSGRTIIGNDVWIGARSLIKAGVKIGHGSVVGMGSVVTKDIPAYEIWAGNPAKFIRKRFDDDTTNELLRINWWDFEDDKLKKHSVYSNRVTAFIESVNKDK